MQLTLLFFIFSICSVQNIVAQQFWPFSFFDNQLGLTAYKSNKQFSNPAAWCIDDKKGSSFEVYLPLSIPNLLGIKVCNHLCQDNIYHYQDLSAVLWPSSMQFRLTQASSILVDDNIKVGLALQFQGFVQPEYYGNFLNLTGRFGCQYKVNSGHFISIVLDNISLRSLQRLNIEHFWILQPNVQFSQCLSWNPSHNPRLSISLIQQFNTYGLQFSFAVPFKAFHFSIGHELGGFWSWQISPSWQYGTGYQLQIKLLH